MACAPMAPKASIHAAAPAAINPREKGPTLDDIIRPLSGLVGGDGLEPPTLSV